MNRASMFAYLYDEAKTIPLFAVGEVILGHSPRKWDVPINCVIRELEGNDPELYIRFDRPDYGDKSCFLIPVGEVVKCQSGVINENLFSKKYASGNLQITVDDGREEHNPITITLLKENVESMKELYNYWYTI